MPKVEVEDTQLDALRKSNELFNSLLEDPKVGLGLKRSIKEKFPDAKVRDLEIIDQVTRPYDEKLSVMDTALQKIQQEFSEYKSSVETEKAESRLRSDLDDVQKKYSLTDEGMAKVIELMREKNLAHAPDVAAAFIVSQMPKPEPVSQKNSLVSPRLDIFGMQDGDKDKKWETLHTHPWAFFEDTVIDVLNEAAE